MEYKGYEIIEDKNRIIVENIKDFDLKQILECGQCFRWLRQGDGSYTGVVRGKAANVIQDKSSLIISNACFEDFKEIWFEYFDLGRDYSVIKAKISKDEVMRKAISFGGGIRLLKQDIWEVLISFILSANNMIPRIMKSVEIIAKTYGNEISYDNHVFYSFPDAGKLSETSEEHLDVCKGGFRCRYIIQASGMIKESSVDLYGLGGMNTEDARKELMKLPGVGPKVADCVMLYSGTKCDAFPTDVWIKRVMEELYFSREASFKEIQNFAADYFGELAGFAQQYLFYYARENKIGTK